MIVRRLERIEDYRACQEVQRLAWGITEEGYLMPVSLLVSVQKYGGLVLGAFDGELLVGFAFAFLAEIRSELGLYSQMTAVRPEYQSRGIGYLLKQEQRVQARQRGLGLIAWAFDPLQAGNAAFNLDKLGAECRQYEPDMYGARTDTLNAGLATDRLIAEWRTEAAPQPGLEPGESIFCLAPDGPWRRPERVAQFVGQRLELDIPPLIQALKAQRPDLAALWQREVRAAFLDAFAHGYVASGFGRSADGSRCWYVLEKEHARAD